MGEDFAGNLPFMEVEDKGGVSRDLSYEGEFWERSSAGDLSALKRPLKLSKNMLRCEGRLFQRSHRYVEIAIGDPCRGVYIGGMKGEIKRD